MNIQFQLKKSKIDRKTTQHDNQEYIVSVDAEINVLGYLKYVPNAPIHPSRRPV